jgi:cysteine desulfurase/selenocysteine lyase
MAEVKQINLLNKNVKHPIILFNIKGVNAQDAAAYLSQKKIVVRSGLSCAKLSDYIIGDKSAVRASLYLYNDKKDIDRLVTALKAYKHGDELKHVI